MVENPERNWQRATLDIAPLGDAKIPWFAEIKFQGKTDFESKEIPLHYQDQIMHQFMASRAPIAWFIGINEAEETKFIPLARSMFQLAEETLLAQEILFWECIQLGIEPEAKPSDARLATDPEIVAKAIRYMELKRQTELLAEEQSEIRKELIALAAGRKLVIGSEMAVTPSLCKGNIVYKNIPLLSGVDLEPYRGKSYSKWSVRKIGEKRKVSDE
jgi:predicted phage-related endonuclease